MLISAHYYRLPPLMAIFSLSNHGNEWICASLLLHYYIQSSITTITAHYFHVITSHFFHYYPLFPHQAVHLAPLLHHYYVITPEHQHHFSLLPLFPPFYCSNGSITASFPPHYYIQWEIPTITAHYLHLITSHYYKACFHY
jgi:hypothetical protein